MRKFFCTVLALFFLIPGGCTLEFAPPVSQHMLAPQPDTLRVHFLDVGQADCALLECGDAWLLIDGGNVEDGQLVVSYLLEQGVAQLDAVICTHPHEDHAGGIPAVLAVFPTLALYSPTATYDSDIFDSILHYADQQDLTVQIPSPGHSFRLGTGDTCAEVTVMGPVKAYPDTNNTSIAVRVGFGDTAFLFTGDMEQEAELDLLDHWYGQLDLRVDVLKVGHHGSDTSSSHRFLYELSPDYAVISVGRDNSYGHPHEEPLSRLRDAGCTVLRTDKLGRIVATSDGRHVSFRWENRRANPDYAETAPAEEVFYIGNKKSLVLHTCYCENLPSEKNQITFDSYQEAVEAGFTPCGNCLR